MKRSLFAPPILHLSEGENTRRVTWLELFFDVVYVAAIIELGYVLTDNVTPQGFLNFVLLFIPIWWSWVGTTLYSNRFDSDDIIHRLLTFAQIFVVTSLAINVYDGTGETFTGFALSYAVIRFILVLMYLRARYFIPQARALTERYIIGFGTAAVLWVIAAFLPAPFRWIVVALALGIDFYTALSSRAQVLQKMLPPSPHHLPERFGLFTIIVLGELFLKVVRELAGQVSPLASWISGACLFIVAASLWWLYFGNIAEKSVRWGNTKALVWMYAHLLLHIALTAFGVGFSKVALVDESGTLRDPYRVLAFGAIALGLLMVGIIERTTAADHPRWVSYVRWIGVAVIALVAVFGSGVNAVMLSAVAALVMVVQVVIDVVSEDDEVEEASTMELPAESQ